MPNIINTPKIEKRTFKNSVERRMNDDGTKSRKVGGYAAMFDTRSSDLGWFVEVLERGCFDGVIEKSDVRCLFNHQADNLLARSNMGEGTLSLTIDDTGLYYEFEMPNTQRGDEILEMLERGDLSQSSFAFRVAKARWEEERQQDGSMLDIRYITEVEMLYDVAPVTYPAYQDTTVAKRSLEQLKQEKNTQKTDANKATRARKVRMWRSIANVAQPV